jgi:hypothetical protein
MVEKETIDLAKRIVTYETQEKGFFGKLFAFEARDGFWSKLAKVLTNVSAPIFFAGASVALLPATAGMLATGAVGLLGAAGGLLLERMAINNVLENMHDSQNSNLSKFGHYLATGILATLPIIGAVAFLPLTPAIELGLNLANAPLLMLASGVTAAVLGNKTQMEQSEQARGLAEVAISRGQSVEQVLSQSVGAVMAPPRQQHAATDAGMQHYVGSVTPQEAALLEARQRQSGQHTDVSHAQRVQEARSTTAQTAIAPAHS